MTALHRQVGLVLIGPSAEKRSCVGKSTMPKMQTPRITPRRRMAYQAVRGSGLHRSDSNSTGHLPQVKFPALSGSSCPVCRESIGLGCGCRTGKHPPTGGLSSFERPRCEPAYLIELHRGGRTEFSGHDGDYPGAKDGKRSLEKVARGSAAELERREAPEVAWVSLRLFDETWEGVS